MTRNRSVPVDTVLPHVAYRDVGAALAWLTSTLGFVEHYHYGPPDAIQGAQLRFGNAWLMITGTSNGRGSPADAGVRTQMITVFLEDVAAHYERVKATGARIVEELNETGYGELQYVVEDPEEHRWIFSRHVRDVSPAEWGATVVNEESAE